MHFDLLFSSAISTEFRIPSATAPLYGRFYMWQRPIQGCLTGQRDARILVVPEGSAKTPFVVS